jgi:serine/threonine protein kinase
MKRRTRKSNSRTRKGGKAIAAGGFGCVFKPALKCKGKSRGSGITKVLIKRNAQDEMNELGKVSTILRRIPNKDDYFLGVDATTCELDNLDTNDKVDFDDKCSNLSRYGINSSNVNTRLSEIAGIDLPYGGLDIENFLVDKKLTPENFIRINNSLIELLKNAIIPMNKLGLFHNDLKANNILVNDTFQTKIIDWGLSATQTGTRIPDIYRTRPFQFNIPFTVCLFSSSFNNFIKPHVRKIYELTQPVLTTLVPVREQIKIIMFSWITNFITTLGGEGHYSYWSHLLENLILIDSRIFPSPFVLKTKSIIIEDSYLMNYIADALTEVVINYTSVDTGDFNDTAFFNDVYKNNVDIWGLISIYFADIVNFIVGSKRLHNNSLTKEENYTLLNAIKLILSKYIFNPIQQANAFDVLEVEKDLKSLNDIFPHIARARTPTPPPRARTPTPPPVIAPGRRSSPILISSLSSPPLLSTPTPPPVVPAPKKTRKKHVVCDDAKKALCRSKGKICNESTGRCNNP